jgi:hypothetical protein
MHGVFAFYLFTGLYHNDVHGLFIDWLAVPAGLYFLYVVQALYSGRFWDWNSAPRPAASAEPGEPARAAA